MTEQPKPTNTESEKKSEQKEVKDWGWIGNDGERDKRAEEMRRLENAGQTDTDEYRKQKEEWIKFTEMLRDQAEWNVKNPNTEADKILFQNKAKELQKEIDESGVKSTPTPPPNTNQQPPQKNTQDNTNNIETGPEIKAKLKEYSITEEEFNAIEGVSLLSSEKKALLMQNMEGVFLRESQRLSIEKQNEWKAEKGFKKKAKKVLLTAFTAGAYKHAKEYEFRAEAKMEARSKDATLGYLKGLAGKVQEGPDVRKNSDGSLSLEYVNSKDFFGDRAMTLKERTLLDKFNDAAQKWSEVPPEWSHQGTKLSKKQRKEFEEKKAYFENMRTELLNIRDGEGVNKEGRAALDMNGIDERVELERLFNAHPEVEKELLKVKTDGPGWRKFLNKQNQVAKNWIKDKGIYFMSGGAIRAGAATVAGIFTGGAGAAVVYAGTTGLGLGAVGYGFGRKDGRRSVESERFARRHGGEGQEEINHIRYKTQTIIDPKDGKPKNVPVLDRQGNKIPLENTGERKKINEFIEADFFSKRLNRQRTKIEELELKADLTEKEQADLEAAKDSIGRTIALAGRKLEQGTVSWGDTPLKGQLDFIQALSRGKVAGGSQYQQWKEIAFNITREHQIKIEEARDKNVNRKAANAFWIRGGFATAGALVADWFNLSDNAQNAANKAQKWSQNHDVNPFDESAKNTPQTPPTRTPYERPPYESTAGQNTNTPHPEPRDWRTPGNTPPPSNIRSIPEWPPININSPTYNADVLIFNSGNMNINIETQNNLTTCLNESVNIDLNNPEEVTTSIDKMAGELDKVAPGVQEQVEEIKNNNTSQEALVHIHDSLLNDVNIIINQNIESPAPEMDGNTFHPDALDWRTPENTPHPYPNQPESYGNTVELNETPSGRFRLNEEAQQNRWNEMMSKQPESYGNTVNFENTPLPKQPTELQSILSELKSPYVVERGDNIWNIFESRMQDEEFFKALSPEQQTTLLDTIEDRIQALNDTKTQAMGIGSTDPDLIYPGDKLFFDKVLDKLPAVKEAVTEYYANNPSHAPVSSTGTIPSAQTVLPQTTPTVSSPQVPNTPYSIQNAQTIASPAQVNPIPPQTQVTAQTVQGVPTGMGGLQTAGSGGLAESAALETSGSAGLSQPDGLEMAGSEGISPQYPEITSTLESLGSPHPIERGDRILDILDSELDGVSSYDSLSGYQQEWVRGQMEGIMQANLGTMHNAFATRIGLPSQDLDVISAGSTVRLNPILPDASQINQLLEQAQSQPTTRPFSVEQTPNPSQPTTAAEEVTQPNQPTQVESTSQPSPNIEQETQSATEKMRGLEANKPTEQIWEGQLAPTPWWPHGEAVEAATPSRVWKFFHTEANIPIWNAWRYTTMNDIVQYNYPKVSGIPDPEFVEMRGALVALCNEYKFSPQDGETLWSMMTRAQITNLPSWNTVQNVTLRELMETNVEDIPDAHEYYIEQIFENLPEEVTGDNVMDMTMSQYLTHLSETSPEHWTS